MVNDLSDYNVYTNKDGRMRAYNKITHAVTSYPRLLVENKLGRKLLHGEDVHHIDENPLNNDLDNLEVISHSEHDRYHGLNSKNRKWFDKEMICPVCGKMFVWTAIQQSAHYSQIKRQNKKGFGPFCSKSCCGKYSTDFQYHNGEKYGPVAQSW